MAACFINEFLPTRSSFKKFVKCLQFGLKVINLGFPRSPERHSRGLRMKRQKKLNPGTPAAAGSRATICQDREGLYLQAEACLLLSRG